MEFLYFPEDKTEYIPGIIMLLFFTLGAIVTTYFFFKLSKKEEKNADKKYQTSKMNSDTERK
ncbi:MAG TPA: hypothetical protein VK142_08245 [Bacillota bacterium]|nr:hypothetical protein [Bacillota bacterium]